MTAAVDKTCGTCGGTGKVICINSAFMADGTRKERCGICGGTGKSGYQHHDHAYVKWQAAARKTFPRHPHYQPKEPTP